MKFDKISKQHKRLIEYFIEHDLHAKNINQIAKDKKIDRSVLYGARDDLIDTKPPMLKQNKDGSLDWIYFEGNCIILKEKGIRRLLVKSGQLHKFLFDKNKKTKKDTYMELLEDSKEYYKQNPGEEKNIQKALKK